jgi:hypothetical protein
MTVSLPELTYFRFEGSAVLVEELVAGLDIPSLQKLYLSLFRGDHAFRIPHLSAIIHNMGRPFYAAQIKASTGSYIISLLTHSHVVDGPSLSLFTLGQSTIAQIGSELSAMLSTVEDLFISLSSPSMPHDSPLVNIAPFFEFLEKLHNVKVLRVQHGLETEVADVLRAYNRQPTTNRLHLVADGADLDATISTDIPINPNEFNVGIFPSLERIEVHPKFPGTRIPGSKRASYLKPFEEFVTARQQAGRPVKVYCNTDQVPPTSFYAWS